MERLALVGRSENDEPSLYVQSAGHAALVQFTHGDTRSHLNFFSLHRRQETTGLGRLREAGVSSMAATTTDIQLDRYLDAANPIKRTRNSPRLAETDLTDRC